MCTIEFAEEKPPDIRWLVFFIFSEQKWFSSIDRKHLLLSHEKSRELLTRYSFPSTGPTYDVKFIISSLLFCNVVISSSADLGRLSALRSQQLFIKWAKDCGHLQGAHNSSLPLAT